MRLRLSLVFLALSAAAPASAEVILSCTFPTIPSVVMRFPDGLESEKQMIVAERPAVPLTEGQGTGRLISAEVDGYKFRFAPQNSVMDVEKDDAILISETGVCVTIGGPVNEAPLKIEKPPTSEAAIAPSELVQTAEDRGNWRVSEDKSAFDDSRTVVLSLSSDQPIAGRFGAANPAEIYLRCQENSTSLYLVLNDQFLSDIQGFGSVDYRIDEQKASVARMTASTDNQALGLWDGGKSIPLIKKLLTGNSVVFRATPFNESPIEFSFTLAGLKNAVRPLKEACVW